MPQKSRLLVSFSYRLGSYASDSFISKRLCGYLTLRNELGQRGQRDGAKSLVSPAHATGNTYSSKRFIADSTYSWSFGNGGLRVINMHVELY